MTDRRKSGRVTIVDVAERAGYSLATASNALSGRRPVDEATRAKVEAAAAALGYRPHLGARRLRMGGSESIAVFSSMPTAIAGGASRLGFMMEIAEAAAVTAMQQGIAVVLVPPVAADPAAYDDLQIDGALVIEPLPDDPFLALVARRRLPAVTIGRSGETAIAAIDLQAEAAAGLVLDHLAATGARRIALMTGASARASHRQVSDVYHAFCARHGLVETIVRVAEDEGEAGGFRAAAALLAATPAVDAIFASVDTFASGAVRAARAAGRAVPEDLRIATRYDGLRAVSSDPPLTAVRLHLREAAEAAATYLIALMRDPDAAHGPVPALPPPELVVRASSRRPG